MALNDSQTPKPPTFTHTRMLTPSELESLKQDMWRASARLKTMKLPENRKKYNLPV